MIQNVKTPLYSVAALEPLLGRTVSRAKAINDRGQVIGYSYNGDIDEEVACLWKDGAAHVLGRISVNRINNKGQIVGCRVTTLPSLSAVLCENHRTTNLFQSSAPASDAGDINDLGQVVGYAQAPLAKSKKAADIKRGAFCWERGKRRYLQVPPGYRAVGAAAINNRGTIIGNVRDSTGEHAAVWQGDAVGLLGEPEGFQRTQAEAVNDLDQILVRAMGAKWTELSEDDYELEQQSFLWQEGQWQAVNGMGLAYSLNNQGQLVGWIGTDPETAPGPNERGDTHAALWEAGQVVDLNDVVTQDSGWLLERAVDINNRGQIVGNGVFGGSFRAFLMTPTRI